MPHSFTEVLAYVVKFSWMIFQSSLKFSEDWSIFTKLEWRLENLTLKVQFRSKLPWKNRFHEWTFREDWASLVAYKGHSCSSSPQSSFCSLDPPEPHSFASLSSFVAMGDPECRKSFGKSWTLVRFSSHSWFSNTHSKSIYETYNAVQ